MTSDEMPELLPDEISLWLMDRRDNCLRIAKNKIGEDHDEWLRDAAYFEGAIRLIDTRSTPTVEAAEQQKTAEPGIDVGKIYDEVIERQIKLHHDKSIGDCVISDLFKQGVMYALEAAKTHLTAISPQRMGGEIAGLINEAHTLITEPTDDGLHIMRAEFKLGKALSLLNAAPRPELEKIKKLLESIRESDWRANTDGTKRLYGTSGQAAVEALDLVERLIG